MKEKKALPRYPIYIVNKKELSVRDCTLKDIPVHIGLVCQFWDNIDVQIDRMKNAVSYNTAWVIEHNEKPVCFLYGIEQPSMALCGIAFWCKTKLHAMIGYAFVRDNKRYRSIEWNPHKYNEKTPFKFMLNDRMITHYMNHGEFIGIRIPNYECESLLHEKAILYNIEVK